jgi:hypothetical protein
MRLNRATTVVGVLTVALAVLMVTLWGHSARLRLLSVDAPKVRDALPMP